MKQGLGNVSFTEVCRLFGKSRQAWYDTNECNSTNRLQEELVLEWVQEIRNVLPRTGVVKLYKMLKDKLRDHHMKMGRDGLLELLRKHELLIQPRRKYICTTPSRHHYKKWPNLLESFRPCGPDQVWVDDITFLRTESGLFICLLLLMHIQERL